VVWKLAWIRNQVGGTIKIRRIAAKPQPMRPIVCWTLAILGIPVLRERDMEAETARAIARAREIRLTEPILGQEVHVQAGAEPEVGVEQRLVGDRDRGGAEQ
jgi:hypothetical protein